MNMSRPSRQTWPRRIFRHIRLADGHANESKHRRNSFWSSMTRIANMMNYSIDSFSSSVRHNFNSAIRRALALRRTIGDSEMRRQAEYYRTDVRLETCRCGLSQCFERVFDGRFPCCHLLYAGVTKPVMSDPPVLVMSEDPSKFRVELEKAERPGEESSRERRGSLVIMTAHSIKRLRELERSSKTSACGPKKICHSLVR
jgi:hypothetical protein